jgi:hypothetical protein
MRSFATVAALVCCLGQGALAQGTDQGGDAPQVSGRGGRGANRAQLEARLRQTLASRARVELGLGQDQMSRLSDVEGRFGPQMRKLDQQENSTRRDLRMAILEPPSADQDRRVGQLNDQLLQLQHQRLDLVAAEQKELSGFLNNTQRVRFEGLKENFRRQIQMDLGRGGAGPGGRRGPPPR